MCCDMDTRIRLGLIGKLHVPEGLNERLCALQIPIETHNDSKIVTDVCLSSANEGVRYTIRRHGGDEFVICKGPNRTTLFKLMKNSWTFGGSFFV